MEALGFSFDESKISLNIMFWFWEKNAEFIILVERRQSSIYSSSRAICVVKSTALFAK